MHVHVYYTQYCQALMANILLKVKYALLVASGICFQGCIISCYTYLMLQVREIDMWNWACTALIFEHDMYSYNYILIWLPSWASKILFERVSISQIMWTRSVVSIRTIENSAESEQNPTNVYCWIVSMPITKRHAGIPTNENIAMVEPSSNWLFPGRLFVLQRLVQPASLVRSLSFLFVFKKLFSSFSEWADILEGWNRTTSG